MSVDLYIKSFLDDLECEQLYMLDILSAGKRLRTKLVLNIAKEDEKALLSCACIELIHAASLLHDDVIDEANTRRGKISCNAKYGAKNAIMLGDILYSKAFFELAKMDVNIAKIISNSVVKLSIGELMDVKMSESFNCDEDLYIKMIYNKTASLIEASARVGAYLSKLDEKDFANYGKNLGLAFQIIDDILDVKADELLLGKPVLADFKEGKSTLIYIYLYKYLDKESKEKLKSLFKKELDEKEFLWFEEKLLEFDIINICKQKADDYAKEALKAIAKYKNQKLESFIKSMVDREF